jgi:hypothetical protein
LTIGGTGSLRFQAGSQTVTNSGAVTVADGGSLQLLTSQAFTNAVGGTIAETGSGSVSQIGGSWTQTSGAVTGSSPVQLQAVALHLSGTGAAAFLLTSAGTLSGNVASSQSLTVTGSCSTGSGLETASGSFTSSGAIHLVGTGCGTSAGIQVGPAANGTLTSKGTLTVDAGNGGGRALYGSLSNQKTLTLDAGTDLRIQGAFEQTAKGTLQTSIAGTSSVGQLHATGAATLAGALSLVTVPPFTPAPGQTFPVVAAASRSGQMTKVVKAPIGKAGLYYRPVYDATSLTLAVSKALLAVSPGSGPAGSSVTVTGDGWSPGETVGLTFQDKGKHKTTLAPATPDASGHFSVTVQIPTGATSGAGKLSAKASVEGVSTKTTFTVV